MLSFVVLWVDFVFSDVVYVIYIFGLIGELKGVVIEYCVIVNCLLWMCE